MTRPRSLPPLLLLLLMLPAASAAVGSGSFRSEEQASCFIDNATGPTSYKFAPGDLFSTPHHGLRLTENAQGCCSLCLSFENCSFWTFEYGGTAAKPNCYGEAGACCFLKTAAAWAGRASGGAVTVSGSTKPLPHVDLCCRNGTNCGGTNLWTKWEDTSLPNSTYTNPGNMPYPKSTDLVDWEFKSGANPGYGSLPGPTMYKAASADTFYPTWAADNKLYTGFTDGNVCDYETGKCVHVNSEPGSPPWTVTHGQAAIVGDDPFALNITDVKTFSGYTGSPYKARFPSSMLAYKGTLWYGTYWVPPYKTIPWSTTPSVGPLVDYRHSTDGGKTWVEPRVNATGPTDNLFGENADQNTTSNQVKFATPHFVDFGQELEHSPDGKAYIISHGNDETHTNSAEAWMLGNAVFMARVAPTVTAINDRSQWEFYAGGNGKAAKWVRGDVTKAAPLVEYVNHTGSATMTYFAGISKYIITICTTSRYPILDGGHFDTYFLESDSITGPWKYITYLKSFGPQVYFANHVSKFTAKQAVTTGATKTFESFLMYSANYDPGGGGGPNPPNSAYHMNLQQTRFTLSDSFAAKLEAAQQQPIVT